MSKVTAHYPHAVSSQPSHQLPADLASLPLTASVSIPRGRHGARIQSAVGSCASYGGASSPTPWTLPARLPRHAVSGVLTGEPYSSTLLRNTSATRWCAHRKVGSTR